jgi:ATP-dependent Clp protease ATP-binding subunit ClpA
LPSYQIETWTIIFKTWTPMMIASVGKKPGLIHRVIARVGIRTFYTEPFDHSTTAAADIARRLQQNHIGPTHLLLGLLQEGKTAIRLLDALGVDLEELKQQADALVQQAEPSSASLESLLFSEDAKRILYPGAFLEARQRGARVAVIGSEHLLLALLKEEHEMALLLDDHGVNHTKARAVLHEMRLQERA